MYNIKKLKFSNYIEKFFRVIYPQKCGLCGEKINLSYTCRKCLNIIEYYHDRVEITVNNEIYYDKIISAICYKGTLKQKMLQYKFRNKKYMTTSFAEILYQKVKKYDLNADIIIPVPISKERMKERGYNQSELIARYLGKFMNLQHEKDVLIKIKNNLRQSELTQDERKNNVKDAYSIKNIDIVKNKKILLIDDIFTTGATLNECAKELKKAGAKEVIALTVMYAEIED